MNPRALHETQETRDLEFATECRAVAVRAIFETRTVLRVTSIPDDQPDRHVRSDDFPDGARPRKVLLQPGHLIGAHEGRFRTLAFLPVIGIRSAEAAKIEHEDIE